MKRCLIYLVVFSVLFTLNVRAQNGAGQALNLDGNGDYVTINHNSIFDITNNLTVEAWIKPLGDNLNDNPGLVSKMPPYLSETSGWDLIFFDEYATGRPKKIAFWYVSGGSSIALRYPTTISINEWFHVAAVFSNGNVKLFKNGIILADSTFPVSYLTPNNQPITIGGQNGSSENRNFNGIIDEVRVWNIARSTPEIQSTMNRTLNGNEIGLVGYWKFDGNANDGTSNGNNGALNGNANFVTSGASLHDRHEYAPDGNTILLLHLNELSGTTVYDVSSNGNNGTLTGTVYVSGMFGGARKFPNSGDGIIVNKNLFGSVNGSYSIEMWLFPVAYTDINDKKMIWDQRNSSNSTPVFTGYIDVSGRISILWRDDGGTLIQQTGNASLPLNTWSHIAVVKDSLNSNIKIYIDGTLDFTAPRGSVGTLSGLNIIAFGRNASNTDRDWMMGIIDEIRVSNRARTQQEIQNYLSPGSDLVAYFPFNGNAIDESNGGHNGTILGAILSTDRFGNPNHAFSFDGINDCIKASASGLPVADRTVSLWFKTTNVSNEPNLLGYGGISPTNDRSWMMGLNTWGLSGYTVTVHSQPPGGGTTVLYPYGSPPLDTWHHFVATTSAFGTSIYIDGQLKATQPFFISNTYVTDKDLIIGAGVYVDGLGPYAGDHVGYYQGLLDDIRIYNRALSDAEIQELYHEGEIVDTTTLWKLQLTASIGASLDSDNYIGVGQGATDGFDETLDIPEPPEPPGNFLQLYFPHSEFSQPTGNNFMQDIRHERALADATIRWAFEVKTNIENQTVNLNFTSDGRIPSEFGMILRDITGGIRKNLKKEGMNYSYNTASGGIRKFEILVGDSTPPALTVIRPNGGEILRSGNPYNLQWNVTDGTGVDSLQLLYSTNAGASYNYITSLFGALSTFPWLVPPIYLNYQGSIGIIAVDSMGNTSKDASNKVFTLVGDSLATVFTAGWNLIGTALKPNDSTLVKIFSDDISNSYYVFSYIPPTGYVRPWVLEQGKGYWLGLLSNQTPDVIGQAVTDSLVIPLLPGFNIISNPLVIDVPKSDLLFKKGVRTELYSTAIDSGWISSGIQAYNKSTNSYQLVDTFEMWTGYWIGTLMSGVEMIVKPPATVLVPETPPKSIRTDTDWQVNIIADAGEAQDRTLAFGIKPDATTGFDTRYDIPKAPAPPAGKNIETYFSEPTWAPVLGSKFISNITAPSAPFVWEFYVKPSESVMVSLKWNPTDIQNAVPSNIILELTDVVASVTIDMRKSASYTFTTQIPRKFKVQGTLTSAGRRDGIPTEFDLGQNYPNPFNPSTVIPFTLPSRSFVKLEVLNVIGQCMVKVFEGEKDAGYHQLQWNAELPSGVYFYRVEAISKEYPNSRFMKVMKLIVLR